MAGAIKINNTEPEEAAMHFKTLPLHACIWWQAKPLAFYTACLDKITTHLSHLLGGVVSKQSRRMPSPQRLTARMTSTLP